MASILQIGIGAIRAGAAVFPIAKPLEAILTPELATQVSKAIGSYRKPTDRELLARPVPYLSKFLNDVLAQAGRRQRVLLIFDEYELSPMQLDAWLRGMLTVPTAPLTRVYCSCWQAVIPLAKIGQPAANPVTPTISSF